jgi:ketosteroid isomerase-like protein
MSFRETLGRHLLAIEKRDLESLAASVADPLILVMADGKLKRSKAEFVEAHRGWFAMQNWTLNAKPVETARTRASASPCCISITARTRGAAKAISRWCSRTVAANG